VHTSFGEDSIILINPVKVNVKPSATPITLLFLTPYEDLDGQGKKPMKLNDLRPGMEHVNIRVKLVSLEEPREVETSYGITHMLVEGLVEDDSGRMGLTVWNERIEQLGRVKVGENVELKDCFVTSFKGVLSVNVGRDSEISSSDSADES
jgi:ssDNA-binding replication factor A large subunit